MPLLKKTDLDPTDVKSYRLISNLPLLSKLLERLIARQLIAHRFELLSELQSAYIAHHSTETAVLKVLGDILRAIDGWDLAALTLLDRQRLSTPSTTRYCYDASKYHMACADPF